MPYSKRLRTHTHPHAPDKPHTLTMHTQRTLTSHPHAPCFYLLLIHLPFLLPHPRIPPWLLLAGVPPPTAHPARPPLRQHHPLLPGIPKSDTFKTPLTLLSAVSHTHPFQPPHHFNRPPAPRHLKRVRLFTHLHPGVGRVGESGPQRPAALERLSTPASASGKAAQPPPPAFPPARPL